MFKEKSNYYIYSSNNKFKNNTAVAEKSFD